MGQLCSSPAEKQTPQQQQQQAPKQAQPAAVQKNNVAAPAAAPAAARQPHHAGGGKPVHAESSSAGDSKRFDASQHAQKRGELMAQSQAAWDRGDKGEAKTLSEAGKKEGALMDKCNQEAADLYFNDNNSKHGIDTIDLHGLHVDESIAKLEQRLEECTKKSQPTLVVIVGAGNHSVGGAAGRKIKPAVEKLIAQHKLAAEAGVPNGGCITLHFGQSGGFRNNQAKQGDAAGQCAQQ